MNCSTRSCSPSFVVVALLGIILILLPQGAQGFAQSEEDHRAWLRALDSLSSERMLADVTTLSSPAFNGRQTGTADDASRRSGSLIDSLLPASHWRALASIQPVPAGRTLDPPPDL